jgi:hypothetical protein
LATGKLHAIAAVSCKFYYDITEYFFFSLDHVG